MRRFWIHILPQVVHQNAVEIARLARRLILDRRCGVLPSEDGEVQLEFSCLPFTRR